MTELWRELARATGGDDYAHRFAARFDELAASGQDVHGEATFVASLVEPPASILDAGCGTGRVGSRLAELGYDVVGADPDEQMIAVARERSPSIEWTVAGLAEMDFGTAYDVVVIAGNVIPFVELAALPAAMACVAAHTKPGGLVVCGYGVDEEHLPPGAPVVPLSAYDEACAAAGLVLVDRFGGWARERHEGEAGGYAVSMHRRG
jgi:SAM-dependent methyltransferase